MGVGFNIEGGPNVGIQLLNYLSSEGVVEPVFLMLEV